MNDLILYTTEDGRSQIKLRAQEDTVWLTQLEIAELFATSKQNIGQHVKSIFEEGELLEASVVKQHFTTAADGKRYLTLLYNLDAILTSATTCCPSSSCATSPTTTRQRQRRNWERITPIVVGDTCKVQMAL